jgi:heterodisulfide reductase subunit C
LELHQLYLLSQQEAALPLDGQVISNVANQVADYIKRSNYDAVVLLDDPQTWGKAVKQKCNAACAKKQLVFDVLVLRAQATKEFLASLESVLRKNLKGTL